MNTRTRQKIKAELRRENPDVMAAGIYKAVQEVTTMPDDIKVKAAMKCMKLGFTPFMSPLGQWEEA